MDKMTLGPKALLLLLSLGLALPPGTARSEDKPRFIRMQEVEIIGTVEHPEITYIIPKTRIVFTPLPLSRDFPPLAPLPGDPRALEEAVRLKAVLRAPGN